MSTFNPYVLWLTIDDFRDAIHSWTSKVREYINDANHAQQQAEAAVTQSRSYLNAAIDTYNSDLQMIQDRREEKARVSDEFFRTRGHLDDMKSNIGSAYDALQKATYFWKSEHSKAADWRRRAEIALEAAKKILAQAQVELAAAADQLNSASRAYDHASSRKNDDGSSADSSYERNRLNDARRSYAIAEGAVQRAAAEVSRCQVEVDRATARIESTSSALAVIRDSAHATYTASQNELDIALDTYAQAQTEFERAGYALEDAEAALSREDEAIEKARRHIDTAQDETDISRRALNSAYQHEAMANQYSYNAQRAMLIRMDKLRELNIPDLQI